MLPSHQLLSYVKDRVMWDTMIMALCWYKLSVVFNRNINSLSHLVAIGRTTSVQRLKYEFLRSGWSIIINSSSLFSGTGPKCNKYISSIKLYN